MNLNLPNRPDRSAWIARMHELAAQGQSCHGCSGKCCTFSSNSMQITASEAREITTYLGDEGVAKIKTKLEECVTEFRLDITQGQGQRVLRKNYTCPFFSHGPLGCTLPKEIKPVGCLAFNPINPGGQGDGFCATEAKASNDGEERAPIPVMILNILK